MSSVSTEAHAPTHTHTQYVHAVVLHHQMNVNIEYGMNGDRELHDVAVVIPLGTSDAPHIANIDGDSKHDARYAYAYRHHTSRPYMEGVTECNAQPSTASHDPPHACVLLVTPAVTVVTGSTASSGRWT